MKKKKICRCTYILIARPVGAGLLEPWYVPHWLSLRQSEGLTIDLFVAWFWRFFSYACKYEVLNISMLPWFQDYLSTEIPNVRNLAIFFFKFLPENGENRKIKEKWSQWKTLQSIHLQIIIFSTFSWIFFQNMYFLCCENVIFYNISSVVLVIMTWYSLHSI